MTQQLFGPPPLGHSDHRYVTAFETSWRSACCALLCFYFNHTSGMVALPFIVRPCVFLLEYYLPNTAARGAGAWIWAPLPEAWAFSTSRAHRYRQVW